MNSFPLLVLFCFVNLKKRQKSRKGKVKYSLNLLTYLWSLSMRFPVGSLRDVAFPSSHWHVFSLSLGPAQWGCLGTGVSAELLESCTQPFLILARFEIRSARNESIKEPKRLRNMDKKLICFVSFTPATSQTNSYFQKRCKCYAFRWDI